MENVARLSLVLRLAAALAAGAAGQVAPPDERFERGVRLHQSGDYQGAIRAYEEFLAAFPDHVEARSNLGAAWSRLGDFGRAIQEYQRALQLDPDNAGVRYNLGLAYYRSSRIPQAAAEFEGVLRAEPANKPAALLLADCRLRMGENKKTIELLEPFAAAGHDDRALLYLLGTALIRDNQVEKGQALIDRILRDGDSPEAHLMLGSLRMLEFENQKALQEFDQAIRLNPKLPSANALRGRALMAVGDTAAALQAFRRELEINPTDFDSNLYVGVLLKQEQEFDKALEFFEKALKIRPGAPAVRYQIGNVYSQTGRLEEALKILEEVVKEAPDFIEGRVNLASVYYQLGRKQDGDREREIIARLNEKKQAANVALGRGLSKGQSVETARDEAPKSVPAPGSPKPAPAQSAPAQSAPAKPAPAVPAARTPRKPATFEELSRAADAARVADQADEAIGLYERALKLKPSWVEGLWYLGTLYYTADRYLEARDVFSRLVRLKPKGGAGWAMLGLCQRELREYERALENLQRGRHLGLPQGSQLSLVTRYHIALLQNRFGESESALQLLYGVARTEGEKPSLIEALGLCALALPYLPQELPPDKREMVLLAGSAHFYAASRQWEKSRQQADALVSRYGDQPNVNYTNGVLLMKDNPDEALEAFKRELAVSPSHALARMQMAFEYIKRAEFETGLPLAEEAVKLAPGSFIGRYALGQVLLGLGETDRAVAELEIAFKLAPDSPETCYQLARAYAAAGRDQDAERMRNEFARLDKIRRALREGPQSIGLPPSAPKQPPPGA